jgi:hypothetical protein
VCLMRVNSLTAIRSVVTHSVSTPLRSVTVVVLVRHTPVRVRRRRAKMIRTHPHRFAVLVVAIVAACAIGAPAATAEPGRFKAAHDNVTSRCSTIERTCGPQRRDQPYPLSVYIAFRHSHAVIVIVERVPHVRLAV